ncbi:MAG TPA: sigma 54-interacting transcriptional regulator [Kofleriaceae bacterium]|nr:sigma 54-interacting transcriptional regulator [Kofleriaceae bacterium]
MPTTSARDDSGDPGADAGAARTPAAPGTPVPPGAPSLPPTLGLVGAPLPEATRRLLTDAGLRLVAPAKAALRLCVGARPPARPPAPPWLWCSPKRIDPADAAAAVLAGAYDVAPIDDGLAALIARRLAELAVRQTPGPSPVGFIAESAAARRFAAELDRAARTSMPVLLTGETGTGKDLAARHLHGQSKRRGELVPINCAAIPNELIEGELFGYARGAFSGAIHDYDGLLRGAAGGTVFLDEVDDTPRTLQMKLLRVLEDHVVSRLGENTWRQVDFRIVAATNRDLEELVRRGEFGADLYQRLAIVRIEVPPLRDRSEDLPELCAHLLARFYREEPSAPHRVERLTAPALAALRRYPWPGNVRELRNVLFHALVAKRAGDELLLSDLPEHVVRAQPGGEGLRLVDRAAVARAIDGGRMNLRAARDELERAALELALERAGRSPAAAARLLGEVGRGASSDPAGTVRAMMRRHGLRG